jgi:hypothetical protein
MFTIPAVVVVLNIVHPDNGVLHARFIIVGVRLGAHPEGVGLEAGLAEHCIEPAKQTHKTIVNFRESNSDNSYGFSSQIQV